MDLLTNTSPLLLICENAHQLFYKTLEAVCQGEETGSVRTGKSIGSFWGGKERPTRELRYATLVLENPLDRMVASPLFDLEKVIPRAVFATLSDENELDALCFYDPKAVEFSDDGKTMPTNYGYRMRHLDQVDQVAQVIEQLKEDPYSRRALIHVHSPRDVERKYNPCIDSLHFLIRNGKLECRSSWRSENALTLLPVNVFEFSLLQELVARELGICPGRYIHTVTSLHVYEDSLQRAETVLQAMDDLEPPSEMAPMPPYPMEQVALIRKIEKKWRNGKPASEWVDLDNYWQKIAAVISSAIQKRLN